VKIISIINAVLEAKYLLHKNKVNVLSFLTNNYGDYYNRILIKKILNTGIHLLDINLYYGLKLEGFYSDQKILTGIGSIIHFATKNSVIWGTGSVWYNSAPTSIPKEVLAVRGRLTRGNLINNSILCPEVYGDPGLLIKKYSSTERNIKFKLGIIPHKSEKNLYILKEFSKIPEVRIIDIEDTKTFLNDLNSCEKIASSSLHGLVFSDSFQIPNIWISLSDKIDGGQFKYHDYYSSIYRSDITNMKPIKVTSSNEYHTLLKSAFIKSIDLDLDILENKLISYYKSI
jgi:pyruvyltransferase